MNIRTKFLIMSLVVLVSGISISMFWLSYSSSKNITREALANNDNFSQAVRETTFILMKTGQQGSLNEYFDRLKKFKHLYDIRLIRSAALERELGMTSHASVKDEVVRQVLGTGHEIVREVNVGHDRALRTVMPVNIDRSCLGCHTGFHKGQTVAALNVVYIYQSSIDQMFRDVLKNAFVQCIVFIFVTGFVLILFNVLVIQPIDRLRVLVKKFGQGDWSVPDELRRIAEQKEQKGARQVSLDEINELAVTFFEMSRNLQQMTVSRDDLSKEINERRKLEEDLRSSHEYLYKVMDAVADPIFVKDRQHRWVLFNQAYCEFMGRGPDEIRGKSDYDFFPKEEADVFWAKDEEVFQNSAESVNEEFFTDAKGVRRTIITKKTLYKDAQGNKYIVGNIQDITERKIKEDELRRQARELKIFYDASMGREERILELKKEVEKLKTEIASLRSQ
ncbi:MAG: PAS domain S-box protein [Candidatus Omnitrophica bacterium]|nr:PAS domain S-box protein [Candidatus Omnitrophota bacterium]